MLLTSSSTPTWPGCAFDYVVNIYIHIYNMYDSLLSSPSVDHICCILCTCLTTSAVSFLYHPKRRSLLSRSDWECCLLCVTNTVLSTPFYLELLRIVVLRYYYMRRRVRRLLPGRIILVISLSAYSATSTMSHRFRPSLLLYYWSLSYISIEE